MKTAIRLLFVLTLLTLLSAATVFGNNVNISLDGEYMETEAVIVDGRTLLPARAIVEMLGGDVSWDGELRAVSITHGDTFIVLRIDYPIAQVDGESYELDVPPQIVNDLTKVPLRFIAEALGLDVEFDGAVGTVFLTSAGFEVVQLPGYVPVPQAGLASSVVYRVIDGDTIELVGGERVRFIGLDAPEVGEPGAAEATEFVRLRIEGQRVWLEPDGNDRDAFGRLRRLIWLQEPADTTYESYIRAYMLNAMLLEYGLACVMIVGNVTNEALFRRISVDCPSSRAAAALQIEQQVAAIVPQIEQQEASVGNFIGNRNSQIFHLPTCRSLPMPVNRIYFVSRQDALDAGHRACRICNP